jgi:hypothetical protein
MSVGGERIQVLEGVRIWQTRKVNVKEVGVLTKVSQLEIRLLTIIEVSIVLHYACSDEW